MRGLACGGLSQRVLNASHVFPPYTTTTSGRSLAIRCMHVPYTVITRGRQPLKRSIIYAACITGHCGGLIRSARWKQAASKSCPEWTSTMFRVMNVRCSHRRVLAFFPHSPFLSSSLVPCLHQVCASMTGDLRRCPRDPWVANQVLRRASTAAAPSSFVPTVYFDGPKNDGPITRQRKAADFDAWIRRIPLTVIMLESNSGGETGRLVSLWRLTSDKSRGPFLGWGRVVDYSIERRPSCSDMKSTLLLP